MDTPGSIAITRLYRDMRDGDPDALGRLWPAYFRRLAALADKKLRNVPSAPSDGEDVALDALKSFHRRALRGDFAQIDDRDDLWRQLATLAHQKAVDVIRRANRLSRGGGKVVLAIDLAAGVDGPSPAANLPDPEPGPEQVAEFAELVRDLMADLGTDADGDMLRKVARLRMELCSGKEIAKALGVSESTVDRKLDLVRTYWKRRLVSDPDA